MKFKIHFNGKYKYAVNYSRYLGVPELLRAREETGVEKLSAERITPEYVYLQRYYVEVPIDEELAVKLYENHRYFDDGHILTVDVPGGSLNRFVHLVTRIERDETTGEVKKVRFVPTLYEEYLVEEWIEAGAPLEWDPSGNAETEGDEPESEDEYEECECD